MAVDSKKATRRITTMAEPLAHPARGYGMNSRPSPGNLFAMGRSRALSKDFT